LLILLKKFSVYFSGIDPWPLFVVPAVAACAAAVLNIESVFRIFCGVTLGLMVKETQASHYYFASIA